MVRINTQFDVTTMTDEVAFRYSPVVDHPRESMSQEVSDLGIVLDAYPSVSSITCSMSPQPAGTSFIDIAPEFLVKVVYGLHDSFIQKIDFY
jgi:hypothetical protein